LMVMVMLAVGTITVNITMTINFEVKLNGGVLATVAIPTVTIAAQRWELESWTYCKVVGAASTATMETIIVAIIYSSASPAAVFTVVPAITQLAATVNTTTTQAFDLQMDFGTSETSNTAQCLFCELSLE